MVNEQESTPSLFYKVSAGLVCRSAQLPANPIKIRGYCRCLTPPLETAAPCPCSTLGHLCGDDILLCWKECDGWGHIPDHLWWENSDSHLLRYIIESTCKVGTLLILLYPLATSVTYLYLNKKDQPNKNNNQAMHCSSVYSQKERLSLYITFLASCWTSALEVVQKIKLVLIRAAVYWTDFVWNHFYQTPSIGLPN